MDKTIKYLKRATICMSILVLCFGAKKAREYVFGFDGYSCNFDNAFSSNSKNSIFDFINQDENLKTCSFDKISKKVKDKFSFVKDIDFIQLTNGILKLDISGLKPKYLINGLYVLAENKELLKKDLFSKESIDSCKNILVHTNNLETEVTQSCKDMIFSLHEKLFDHYQIERESIFVSYMHDKNNKNFSILFSDNTIIDEKVIKSCQLVRDELQSKGEFSGKKTKNWLADIRFKDQIVLFNQIRGR